MEERVLELLKESEALLEGNNKFETNETTNPTSTKRSRLSQKVYRNRRG